MKKKILSLAKILFGVALTDIAMGMIVLPQNFAVGGVTGLSVLLSKSIPLSVSMIVLFCNAILFTLGYIFIGRKFILKTLLVSIAFPIGLDICQRINFLLPLKSDPLVSAIIAGLLVGIGSGLVLKGDGSNGGFDILGVIFNKYFKISVAVVMNICNCLVLLAQALQKDFMQNLYGLIVIFICAFAVNRVLSYGQSQCEIMIMSKEHIKIKQRIYEEVDAGLTLLHAESGYLSEKMKVIMVVTQYKKIAEVKQIAVSEDPTAFIFVSDVHSVSGKGYTISR